MGDGHLERLRRAELDSVRAYFPVGRRVLEVGGGNGFQANVIAGWGCVVESVDLDVDRWEVVHFPVRRYDGEYLPFTAGSFDVVFSSNVLEHVAQLPSLLAETRRVLAPGGIAVHIVPTPVWRFWTLLAHYPGVLWRLAGGRSAAAGRRLARVDELARDRGWGALVRDALLPPPHGAFPSALAELGGYRLRRWQHAFAVAGWTVERVIPNGLFYTGAALCPGLPLALRRRLAVALGSACRAFVLRPCDVAEIEADQATIMPAAVRRGSVR